MVNHPGAGSVPAGAGSATSMATSKPRGCSGQGTHGARDGVPQPWAELALGTVAIPGLSRGPGHLHRQPNTWCRSKISDAESHSITEQRGRGAAQVRGVPGCLLRSWALRGQHHRTAEHQHQYGWPWPVSVSGCVSGRLCPPAVALGRLNTRTPCRGCGREGMSHPACGYAPLAQGW